MSIDKSGSLMLKWHSSIVGIYRCKAVIENIGTVVSRLFRVNIADLHVSQLTSRQMGHGRYRLGGRAVLVCPYWTVPDSDAEYRWLLNNSAGLHPVQPSKASVMHHKGQMLEIEVSTLAYGTYHCEIICPKYGLERTGPNISVAPPNVDVKGPPSPSDDRLVWLAKPPESLLLERRQFASQQTILAEARDTVIIREGTPRLELVCVVDSFGQAADISWLKDGIIVERVAAGLHGLLYDLTGQGSLVLINTSQGYSGEYTCKATIRHTSRQIQSSIKLFVKPPIRFADKPVPIVAGDVDKEMLLSCRLSDGDTRTVIHWRKNGELISSSSYVEQRNGMLRISRLLASDEGVFQCLAEDEFTALQATVRMKINKAKSRVSLDYRPLPVRNLEVSAVSYRTLNISWTHAADGFENILHYEISLLDLSGLSKDKPKISLKADRLESSVLVKNLEPDSFHRIYVYAINGSGTSYPAVIKSSPRVLSKAPSAAPTKLSASNIGSGVALIQWTALPPDKIHGELLGYRLIISSTDGIYSRNLDIGKEQLSAHVSDLIPDSKYYVKIQAKTRGGRGPLSATMIFATPSVSNRYDASRPQTVNQTPQKVSKDFKPFQLPGKINTWVSRGLNHSIALQWSHPSRGGTIRIYKVKWGKVYPGPSEVSVPYPSSAYVIKNLEMRTQYMIKIIPTNDAGEGKELLFAQFTGSSDITRIPIPLNLRIENVAADTAIVSWEDPGMDRSDARVYQARYDNLDRDVQMSRMVNTTRSTLKVAGLTPSTTYAFSVRTGDVVPSRKGDHMRREWRWSEWSLKETFSTDGESPKHGPTEIGIVVAGKPDVAGDRVTTRVIVSWSHPDRGINRAQEEIIGYTVMYTDQPRLDLDSWQTLILPKDQLSVEISLSGTEKVYYFRVGCRTTNFQCPLSRLLFFRTADMVGDNYGVLNVPEKYHYSVDVPASYLHHSPINGPDSRVQEKSGMSRDMLWLIVGIVFGASVFLLMLLIVVGICFRRRSRAPVNGYDLGTKYSDQNIAGAGLMLSNQSPTTSKGNASPPFTCGFKRLANQPDITQLPEPTGRDIESDSNQDNASLRLASVSQPHLAATCTSSDGIFLPASHNQSAVRSHPQMTFYPDMAAHGANPINSTAPINSLVNINNITISNRISDTNLIRLQSQQNAIYPFAGHQFVPQVINAGSFIPICSPSFMQPIHFSTNIFTAQPSEMLCGPNYQNTPRVNANEVASHTSSEDIRPSIHCSRINEASKFSGNGQNSAFKPKKTKTNLSFAKKLNTSPKNSNNANTHPVKEFNAEKELHQEMAILEGLMEDLSAIAQREFEC